MRSSLAIRPTTAIPYVLCLLALVASSATPSAAGQLSRLGDAPGALPAAASTGVTAARSRSAVAARGHVSSVPALLETVSAPAVESIIYDDGEADNGYGPQGTDATDFAMRFDLPRPNMRVDQIQVCLQRTGLTDDDLDFDIVFWEADGPGGSPGTLIDFLNASALNIPLSTSGTFFTYDLSAENIVMPSSTVYVGVGWDAGTDPDFFVCSDYDRPTVQPGFFDPGQDGSWIDLSGPQGDPSYTALMLRGVFSDLGPTGPCVADDTTMCLLNDRFKVQVNWATAQGTSGPGHVVPFGSDRAGMFWFFNSENWEMLIKMLNACTLDPPRFWVFFAATTNVEFTLTVTDTETGFPKVYHNDLNHRADAVTDTSAFSTCP